MLTQKDFDELEKTFATKDDIRNEIRNLQSDLLNVMDEILVEVPDSRTERTIQSEKISEHKDRLTTIEDKLGIISD